MSDGSTEDGIDPPQVVKLMGAESRVKTCHRSHYPITRNLGRNAIMGKARIQVRPGDQYGRFTVIEEVEGRRDPSGNAVRQVSVVCNCGHGKARTVGLGYLRNELAKTGRCHCRGLAVNKARNVAHGLSGHPLYSVWAGMIQRCKDYGNEKNIAHYADRNVRVCDEWQQPKPFIEWALASGWRKGLQIDRRLNDGGYEPGNCHFVTPRKNAQNRRTSFVWHVRGERFASCTEAAERFDVSAQTICNWAGEKHVSSRPDCWKTARYGEQRQSWQ